MNFFNSFVRTPEEQPSGAETVNKLCDRVASSTLLEDRRDAVRALKALAKSFRTEVGSQALELLADVLRNDTGDDEILAYALECLYHLTVVEEDDEGEHLIIQTEIASSFVAKFIEAPENVNAVLDLIERSDFKLRWASIRFLTSLLRTKSIEVQQIVLVRPMGVSHIMDLLTDNREVIRNDTVLALIEVTRSNASVQKLVAFENGFDAIFKIIHEEGLSDGLVVVEDCILLLLQLLKSNISNQQFFKEGSFIQYLPPFFEIEAESVWSAQKKANMLLMLKVVRTLVSPTNPSQATSVCQIAMQHCQLLQKLSDVLMATGVPTDILTETINTVSEIIRGCLDNQKYFSTIMAPWDPPRPALVVLLMSMVNAQQPFTLRCAVLYCFQCFLHKNLEGQCSIVNTLLPSTHEPQDLSLGQLLCSCLFALSDPLSNWLAATALCHSLKFNDSAKGQLLRVQLATAAGNPPVTLLKQITSTILQSPLLQTRVGLLSFLCGWLHDCPVAVQCLLADESAVPFLLSQIAENRNEQETVLHGVCALLLGICILNNDKSVPQYTKESLIELIIARIGIERFSDTLTNVTQHELYSKAMQRPQPLSETPENLLLDHSFVKLYKQLEDPIIKIVSNLEELKKEEEQKAAIEAHDTIVSEYKTVIREQDIRLGTLTQKCATLETELSGSKELLASRDTQVQQLKDQYNVLRLTAASSASGDDETQALLQQKIAADNEVVEKTSLIKDLEEKLSLQTAEIKKANEDVASDALVAEKVAMQKEISKLQEKLEAVSATNVTLTSRNALLNEKLESAEGSLKNQEVKFQEMEEQTDGIKKEQDDLLVLLSEQDTKLQSYKAELRKLGAEVSDDDEEDDSDDEEEDEENDEENDEGMKDGEDMKDGEEELMMKKKMVKELNLDAVDESDVLPM